MSLLRTILPMLVTCLPVLPGCTGPTQFTSALTDPGETRYDSRLVGTWYAKGGDFSVFGGGHFNGVIVSVSPRDDNQLAILYRSETEILRSTGYASKVDGDVYYNLRPEFGSYFRAYSKATETPHFLLFRVEFINDDKLFVWTSFHGKGLRKVKHVSLGDGGYSLVEQSREELLATIREISPQKLFAYQLGPFFRIAEPAQKYQASHWLRDDKSGCAVAGPFPGVFKGVSWSGECTDGKASGEGVLVHHSEDGEILSWKGTMIQGRPQGAGQCRNGESGEWQEPCR